MAKPPRTTAELRKMFYAQIIERLATTARRFDALGVACMRAAAATQEFNAAVERLKRGSDA